MNILRAVEGFSKSGGLISIQTLRPGLILLDANRDDLAFGPLARIDYARLRKGIMIRMHEHINDEILSYIHKGELLHEDSNGEREFLSSMKSMVMGSGKSFFHQESTPNGEVEMLQIIIRPSEADLEPNVQFAERVIEHSGKWHLIAGPKELHPPMIIRQQVAILDVHGKSGNTIAVPKLAGMSPFLIVMDGKIELGEYVLEKKDAITGDADELTDIILLEDSTIVLFLVDLEAKMTLEGSISGIQ